MQTSVADGELVVRLERRPDVDGASRLAAVDRRRSAPPGRRRSANLVVWDASIGEPPTLRRCGRLATTTPCSRRGWPRWRRTDWLDFATHRPTDRDEWSESARRIGPIRGSNFGDVFTVEAVFDRGRLAGQHRRQSRSARRSSDAGDAAWLPVPALRRELGRRWWLADDRRARRGRATAYRTIRRTTRR